MNARISCYVRTTILFAPLLLNGRLLGGMDRFVGEWRAAGHGVTKVQIRSSGNRLRLHAFAACRPQDCDWGEVDAPAYAPKVSESVRDAADAVSAQFVTKFSRTLLLAYPVDAEQLRVETFTVFTDRSGRSPYHQVTLLKREMPGTGSSTDPNLALTKSLFRLPQDGQPNNNASIGDMCCTGRTATVTALNGQPLGYIYFFAWTGQAYNVGDTSFAPTIKILLSGVTDTADSGSRLEKASVEFDASVDRIGASREAQAGGLVYKVTLAEVKSQTAAGHLMFDMKSPVVEVSVAQASPNQRR